jgi:hypothetical protein
MSCIKEILRIKADKEVLIPTGSELAVEGGGEYKGYEFIVTFNRMGFRCGYVAIPAEHPLYDKDSDQMEEKVSCHGGVTFFGKNSIVEDILGNHHCEDKWLGFDAGHYYDLYDKEAAEKYFDLRDLERDHMDRMSNIYQGEELAAMRNLEYMENECRSIVDQLTG